MTESIARIGRTAVAPPSPEGLPEGPGTVEAPVRKDRRVLRAVLRWTAAVVVFAAVGASSAYGITRVERTDLPGLGTESDGRWTYPELTRPPLPSGSPGPFAAKNKAGTHYADLRALVLPAPEGATDDKALDGEHGWLATEDFLAEYAAKSDREDLGGELADYGLRHVAARGWTMPDGTRTRVYLLQFDTAALVDELYGHLAPYSAPKYRLRGAQTTVHDEAFPDAAAVDDVPRTAYVEPRPYGTEQVRQAYLSAGDTIAVITQSRKGGAPAVPFQQTVTLQGELLD